MRTYPPEKRIVCITVSLHCFPEEKNDYYQLGNLGVRKISSIFIGFFSPLQCNLRRKWGRKIHLTCFYSGNAVRYSFFSEQEGAILSVRSKRIYHSAESFSFPIKISPIVWVGISSPAEMQWFFSSTRTPPSLMPIAFSKRCSPLFPRKAFIIRYLFVNYNPAPTAKW